MATKEGTNESEARQTLEAPDVRSDGQIDWDSIWLYRRAEGVLQPRPIFTGDVFEGVPVIGEDELASVVLVQHPCALMNKDNRVKTVLLGARLIDCDEVSVKGWSGNYDVMPLVVKEFEPLKHQAVAFDQLVLVQSSDLDLAKRTACMEMAGLVRLLQRWTNVNARVIVPGWHFEQIIETQFAEADGIEAWCTERRHARVKPSDGMVEATAWLDEKSEDTNRPRRDLLKSPQYRKGVIRRMQLCSKALSDRENSERMAIAEQKRATAGDSPLATTDKGSEAVVTSTAPSSDELGNE